MSGPQFIYHMHRLSKIVPPKREILKNINLSFYPGAKIGVVGPNGAGKSSLLKIMAGLDTDFHGEAWAAKGTKIGYLAQEPELDPELDVLGNVELAVAETRDLLRRFEEVNLKFGEISSDEEMNALIEEQAKLQDRIDATGAWDLDRKIEIAMDALRLPDGDTDVSTLSGGEQRRSRPTTSTLNRSPGWSTTSPSSLARSWRSPTTATSWTTSPSGFSSSTGVKASRGRATTRPG